ncbi:class B sortase [Oscillospiraceae bacterium LTW-04]|nr:class B sortase [Oscillospiraceae bacterium MB24-C1]
MNKMFSTKLIALMLVLAMALTFTGCGKKPSSSEEPSSEPTSSSSTVEDEDDDADVVRVFQIEKIDEGIKRNADTKGWLYIPNTEIDDAVVQAKDNDYYLRLTEDKEYSIFGCYYADFRNNLGARDDLSKNTIIYGHSDYKDNPEGKKFSQLFHYAKDIDFVRNNPYIYFSTTEDDLVWQVFAVFYTHIDFNYIQDNPTDPEFKNIISEAKARSEYIIDVPVDENDKILTLSTCTGLYNAADKDNYRMVVMAKLMPSNEISTNKMTMEVKPNPSPKKS